MKNKLNIQILDKSFDSQIAELFDEDCMGKDIALQYRTQPSFIDSLKLKGDFNQAFGVISTEGKLKSLGARSIKKMYLNGKVEDIGYLSSMRVRSNRRGALDMARGYEFLKGLHEDRRTNFYISTIVDDNDYARKLLESGRCGLPQYKDMGLYYTATIPLMSRKCKLKTDVSSKKAKPDDLNIICDFLNEEGKNKQFFPIYEPHDFDGSKAVTAEVFYMLHVNDKLSAVMALWDQRKQRQIVISKYSKRMKMLKSIYNFASGLCSLPLMPDEKSILNSVYGSFIAVKNNAPDLFEQLLNFVIADNKNKYDWISLGFHEKDPLLAVVKKRKHFKYISRLYTVGWDTLPKIDGRIPYLELGAL